MVTTGLCRMGIDLGGTKIEAKVFGASDEVLFSQRIDTPRHQYGQTLQAIQQLVQEAERKVTKRFTVGVGMPGAVSPQTGLVKNANSTWLNGKPFDRDLQEILGRPVRFANDANCFALSEAVDGAGAGHRTVFGVILGTGCGGGIVFDRTSLTGNNAIAGEWGHTGLPSPTPGETPGPECYCGRQGCLETWISGPAFEDQYFSLTTERLSATVIAAKAAEGEHQARSCLDQWLGRVGRGLAAIINILDPDIIVVGGGLSRIDQLYDGLDTHVHPHVFSDICVTPIVKNVHGDASGVRGAAWLWPKTENGEG